MKQLLDFEDILIEPEYSTLSSRKDVDLTTKIGNWNVVPIFAANMDNIGTYETSEVLEQYKMPTVLAKSLPDQLRELTIPSFGMKDEVLSHFNVVCLDVANGYMENFLEKISHTRSKLGKDAIIIAGNVCTKSGYRDIIKAGANICKVGLGSGQMCTTRKMAGVGVPQASAIINCNEAKCEYGGMIMSDGGCSTPGDVAKAFVLGADTVMLGSMLGGHDENSEFDADGYATIYGMSSKTANDKHFGGLKEYRASEGRTVKIKSKGSLHTTVAEVLGGVASACTYTNSANILDLRTASWNIVNRTINRTYERDTVGN